MIWHNKFVWLHLPRTGGTSTTAWFRKLPVEQFEGNGIHIDSDGIPAKHDNLLTRRIREGGDTTALDIVMNFRKLDRWLFSNYRFARAEGLDVPLERYVAGEYFSLRVGAWRAADWWLSYFDIDNVDTFFRLDNLEEDWRRFLKNRLGCDIPQCHRMSVENQCLGYPYDESLISSKEWVKAYERNSKWAEIQERLYGGNSIRDKPR